MCTRTLWEHMYFCLKGRLKALGPGGGLLWEFMGGDVLLGPWNP